MAMFARIGLLVFAFAVTLLAGFQAWTLLAAAQDPATPPEVLPATQGLAVGHVFAVLAGVLFTVLLWRRWR